MSLRRWKLKFTGAKSALTETVSNAVDAVSDKASSMFNTSLTLETAQVELAKDIEKGVSIFDEIGLPQEIGDKFQEDVANYAMKKLEEAWKHPERKAE